jgi:hypothetical protein
MLYYRHINYYRLAQQNQTVCAAISHLPSVSTANTNTVQHPTPHQQYETPKLPTVVISKVMLPQFNKMAAFVHSHSKL